MNFTDVYDVETAKVRFYFNLPILLLGKEARRKEC